MDVSSIVSSAVHEANASGGETPDQSPETIPDASASAPEGESTPAETPAAPAEPAKAEKPKEDDLDPEIKRIVDRSRMPPGKEPHIPLSAHKRVLQNARKEVGTISQERTQLVEKVKTLEKRAEYADKWDQDIQDPDRTIQRLAILMPEKYAKFVQGHGAQTPPQPAKTASAATEFPKPDVRSADGAVGYSPEGLQRFVEWVAGSEERAVAKAEERIKASLKPYEDERQERELTSQLTQTTRQKIAEARAEWGDLFEEDFKKGKDSDVLKYMAQYKVPHERALAAVLLPKLKEKHTSELNGKRESLMKELKMRPEVADKSVPGSERPTPTSTGPRTTVDIVRERVAALNGGRG